MGLPEGQVINDARLDVFLHEAQIDDVRFRIARLDLRFVEEQIEAGVIDYLALGDTHSTKRRSMTSASESRASTWP